MRLALLRNLLLMDAAVLFWLGAVMIVAPTRVEAVFHFAALPPGVNYILGLWGCVLVTLAIGYFVAARDPIRHVAWVQVGIARGALECLVGVVYLSKGIVSIQQAWLGIALAGAITVAYMALYPYQAKIAPRTT